MPATRISKNSSRFELKIERNFTRSINGCVGSWASSRTRRLNSSQLSSRLMKLAAAAKRLGGGGATASGSAIILGGASADISSAGGSIAHVKRGWVNRQIQIDRTSRAFPVFPIL